MKIITTGFILPEPRLETDFIKQKYLVLEFSDKDGSLIQVIQFNNLEDFRASGENQKPA